PEGSPQGALRLRATAPGMFLGPPYKPYKEKGCAAALSFTARLIVAAEGRRGTGSPHGAGHDGDGEDVGKHLDELRRPGDLKGLNPHLEGIREGEKQGCQCPAERIPLPEDVRGDRHVAAARGHVGAKEGE